MAGPVTACRSCGGRLTITMADLGMQPPSNAFLASLAEAAAEKRYPLRAKVCEVCKLVQVDYDVAPQELFGNYVYFSSYSEEWLAHAERYADMALRRFDLGSTSLVVELASNDGYLLKNFLKMGSRCSASTLPPRSRARPRASACRRWSSSSVRRSPANS
jgi:hypothetical protein